MEPRTCLIFEKPGHFVAHLSLKCPGRNRESLARKNSLMSRASKTSVPIPRSPINFRKNRQDEQ